MIEKMKSTGLQDEVGGNDHVQLLVDEPPKGKLHM
jgi:hypothetical protein